MSYVVTAGTKIAFTFLRSAIFNSVNLETLTAASKIEKNGEVMIDEYGMSEDEITIFNEFLREAHMNMSRILIKMTNGVTTAMVMDTTSLIYSVKDKAGYNVNILPEIDENIYQAIKNFIIKEWFVKCALGDLAKYYSDKYDANIKHLVRNSLSLRKPSMV